LEEVRHRVAVLDVEDHAYVVFIRGVLLHKTISPSKRRTTRHGIGFVLPP
jgi:hypothetical protein